MFLKPDDDSTLKLVDLGYYSCMTIKLSSHHYFIHNDVFLGVS